MNNYFKKVRIEKDELDRLKTWAREMMEYKQSINEWKIDNANIDGRFIIGILGERAVEIAFGISFIDYSFGRCRKYSVPDIPQWNMGVKSKKITSYYHLCCEVDVPQIFCDVDLKDDYADVYILGWQEPDVINEKRIFNDLPDTLVLKGKGKVIWGVGELYGFEWKEK